MLGNGGETLRTRWWSKALKSAFPPKRRPAGSGRCGLHFGAAYILREQHWFRPASVLKGWSSEHDGY